MSTSLEFLGHAGFFLKSEGVSLLCDPWLSSSGAFLHRWHQFPPNDFIERQHLYEADYLYISHDHQDHFDREFLKSFPKDKVTVLIAGFASTHLKREVERLGFPRVIELEDWADFDLGNGTSVAIFKDTTLYKTDSALIVKTPEWTILDKNDCHISEENFPRLKDMGIDLLFAQYSGAMWYPAVYHYDIERERELSQIVKDDLINGFVKLANSIEARYVLPCAGPPCFLEDDAFRFNFAENGIFPDQSDVEAELRQRVGGAVHMVMPGDQIACTPDRGLVQTNVVPFSFDNKAETIRRYTTQRAADIEEYLSSLPGADEYFPLIFQKHLRALFSSSIYLSNLVNALVEFRATGPGGCSAFVDLRNNAFEVSLQSDEAPNYTFIVAAPIVLQVVRGRETWEDVLLSMRLDISCQPDVYNWPLFALLRYGTDRNLIAEVETSMRGGERETTVVMDDGEPCVIQRFCPHAGEDLTYGSVSDGKLVCPRHGWMFDLRDGGACIRGGNLPVRVYAEVVESTPQSV